MKHMEKLDSELKEMNRYMANTVTQQELQRELADKITH